MKTSCIPSIKLNLTVYSMHNISMGTYVDVVKLYYSILLNRNSSNDACIYNVYYTSYSLRAFEKV